MEETNYRGKVIISSHPIYLDKEMRERAEESLLKDPDVPELVKEVIRKYPTNER